MFGYPKPKCVAPGPIYSRDSYAIEAQRDQVRRYVACVKKYIDDADSDIERIKEAQQSATDEAKRNVQNLH